MNGSKAKRYDTVRIALQGESRVANGGFTVKKMVNIISKLKTKMEE